MNIIFLLWSALLGILIGKLLSVIKNIDIEKKTNKQLYSCPYDICVGCVMDEGCLGCEEFNADKYDM
jgi:hypothetical protein